MKWITGAILLAAVMLPARTHADQQIALVGDLSRSELFALWKQTEAPGGPAEALPAPFRFPDDARDGSVFGIDVSHHNTDNCGCKIDWQQLKARKVAFVYAKASQGAQYFDPRFGDYWRGLGDARIKRGAYHFLSSDDSPEAQAENFLKIIENAGASYNTDLPPVLDIEWDYRRKNGKLIPGPDGKAPFDFWSVVAPAEIERRIAVWMDLVEKKTGRVPVIYTNASWWRQTLKDEGRIEGFKRFPLWIADYSVRGRGTEQPRTPASRPWSVWQFSETGGVGNVGIPGAKPVSADVNILLGADPALLRSLGR
ncbi:lysozyme [Bradyrhizobium elkanii]|uniref:GH25 family lysozyme n=1 Tax=Bradyrhizobium elkanii TaxID=29448 RepID=UPI0021671949|nr:GH25 family lysozyme [Bradyrhizobium elkanii]MCS3689394.1 lysozyme [Bradyrhizobium elkanii]